MTRTDRNAAVAPARLDGVREGDGDRAQAQVGQHVAQRVDSGQGDDADEDVLVDLASTGHRPLVSAQNSTPVAARRALGGALMRRSHMASDMAEPMAKWTAVPVIGN